MAWLRFGTSFRAYALPRSSAFVRGAKMRPGLGETCAAWGKLVTRTEFGFLLDIMNYRKQQSQLVSNRILEIHGAVTNSSSRDVNHVMVPG